MKKGGSLKLWWDPIGWYNEGKKLDTIFQNTPYIRRDKKTIVDANKHTGIYEYILDEVLESMDPSWSMWKKMVHRALLLSYLGKATSLDKRNSDHRSNFIAQFERLFGKPKKHRYLKIRELHGGKKIHCNSYKVNQDSRDLLDTENLIIFMLIQKDSKCAGA